MPSTSSSCHRTHKRLKLFSRMVPGFNRNAKIFGKSYFALIVYVALFFLLFLHDLITRHIQALNAFTHNRFCVDRSKSIPVDIPYDLRTGVTLDRRGLGQPVGLSTVFGRTWCTTIVDEIHEFRVPTNKGFIGTCELRRISHLVVGATATPLISQPRVRQYTIQTHIA